MDTEHNLENIIVSLKESNGKKQLEQCCSAYCDFAKFDEYFLYGSVYSSMISAAEYIICGPGNKRKISEKKLAGIIQACSNSSTPLVTGNIDTASQLYKPLSRICQLSKSKKLSISYPVHFPAGKFALFHVSAEVNKQECISRITSTLASGHMFAKEAGAAVIREIELRHEKNSRHLSQRERECLLLASDGLSPNDIASKVGLSPHTVIFYLKKAREKLQTKNIQGAISKAILRGDISTLIGSEKN